MRWRNAASHWKGSRSLAALLHEAPDEVLGVRLEHIVDVVEDRVDVFGELLVPLGDVRVGLCAGGDLTLSVNVLLALRAALTTVVCWHAGLRFLRTSKSH